jgi:hypothetical protein
LYFLKIQRISKKFKIPFSIKKSVCEKIFALRTSQIYPTCEGGPKSDRTPKNDSLAFKIVFKIFLCIFLYILKYGAVWSILVRTFFLKTFLAKNLVFNNKTKQPKLKCQQYGRGGGGSLEDVFEIFSIKTVLYVISFLSYVSFVLKISFKDKQPLGPQQLHLCMSIWLTTSLRIKLKIEYVSKIFSLDKF